MTNEEVSRFCNQGFPVLCADGFFGSLVLAADEKGICGVQVPGEENHRWIPIGDLVANCKGAMAQRGFPVDGTAELRGLEQRILAVSWRDRGGLDLVTSLHEGAPSTG